MGTSSLAPEVKAIRRDIYLYNEATGFVITSKSINGKQPGEVKEFAHWIADGSALPFELVQDDPLIFRVVVNDELKENEAEEWVHKAQCKLEIPDGTLALVAGSEYLENPDDHYLHENGFVRYVDVPVGTYLATLYTYIHSVNGSFAFEGSKKAGRWFRKTRPGEPFPGWLKAWCADDPEEDPGHEDEWEEYDEEDDPDRPKHYIDHVLHLMPYNGEKLKLPKLDGGFIPAPRKARAPERAPLGIASEFVEGIDDREPYVQTDLIYTHKVRDLVKGLELQPIQGAAVSIPISKMVLPYWLAWFCFDGVGVQVVLNLPEGQAFEPEWPNLEEGFKATKTDQGWIVDFEGNNAKWSQLGRLRALGSMLQDAPAGTVVELATADDEAHDESGLAGFHRYSGRLEEYVWTIEKTYPAVKREELESALALAQEVENGGPITALDQDELKRIVESAKGDFLLRQDMPQVEGKQLFVKPHTNLEAFLGTIVFRLRHGASWPTLEAEDLSEWDDMMNSIEQKFAATTTGETVYEGQAKYSRADLSSIGSITQEDVRELDAGYAELGFTYLGDLVCSSISDVILRGYYNAAERAYGVVLRNTLGFGGEDFYSAFPDGSSLTTTTIATAGDAPAQKIFRQYGGDDDLEQLLTRHRERAARLTSEQGELRDLDASLEGLAREVDDFLRRSRS